MDSPSARDELAAAIAQSLAELSRRNELRLASVRVFVTCAGALHGWLCWIHPPLGFSYPQLGPTVPCTATGLVAVCLLFWGLLRRGWYVPVVSYLAAVVDAELIAIFYSTVQSTVDAATVQSVFALTFASLCTLYAASGGLRANGGGAILTALLSAGVYLAIGWRLGISAFALFNISAYILIAGLLGHWMSGLTRSVVASALGRVTLERFLPRELIDGAHIDPMALLGAPRTLDATILISDLRGFTAFSESLPPVEVLAFLSELQGALAEAVRANGGVVDKFMGDGMLAVFGAPEADPDHARHAIKAAADGLAALAQINARRAGQQQAAIRVGIGIHSGSVVAGCLGSGQRLEFTVIGDTVNTASRLEALTKEKGVEVLVSQDTAHRAPELNLKFLGSVELRGRVQPLAVFTLV